LRTTGVNICRKEEGPLISYITEIEKFTLKSILETLTEKFILGTPETENALSEMT